MAPRPGPAAATPMPTLSGGEPHHSTSFLSRLRLSTSCIARNCWKSLLQVARRLLMSSPGSTTFSPHTQMALRLAELSHAQLLEIAAAGCEASTEVKNQADAILATHKPLPQWAVEGVLHSSDLLPHVLSLLQLKDGAAAAVCSQWADDWKATSEGRRHLTRAPFNFPQDLVERSSSYLRTWSSMHLAVIPGDDEQLVVRIEGKNELCILARDMSTVASFPYGFGGSMDTAMGGSIVADEQFIYVAEHYTVSRLTHDGTVVASYHAVGANGLGENISVPVLAAGGLLFCVHIGYHDDPDLPNGAIGEEEIFALDAQSLQLRYRFGLGLLNDARGLTVIGEELFVIDHSNHRLQVFSLAGEHRRSITGEWMWPAELCVVKDRIYLVEGNCTDFYEEDPTGGLRGRRIYVLSLQGDTLQVYPMPSHHQPGSSLVCFDDKLLVRWEFCSVYGPEGTNEGNFEGSDEELRQLEEQDGLIALHCA